MWLFHQRVGSESTEFSLLAGTVLRRLSSTRRRYTRGNQESFQPRRVYHTRYMRGVNILSVHPNFLLSPIWRLRSTKSTVLWCCVEVSVRKSHFTYPVYSRKQQKSSSCSRRCFIRIHHKKRRSLGFTHFNFSLRLCYSDDYENRPVFIWDNCHWYMLRQ